MAYKMKLQFEQPSPAALKKKIYTPLLNAVFLWF